jgi:hypothetical protein
MTGAETARHDGMPEHAVIKDDLQKATVTLCRAIQVTAGIAPISLVEKQSKGIERLAFQVGWFQEAVKVALEYLEAGHISLAKAVLEMPVPTEHPTLE